MNALRLLPIVFLLLLPIALSQEDFSLETDESFTLCPCSGQGFPVLLTNTGDQASTYTVSVDKTAQEWVSVSPKKVTLEPNQAVNLIVTVNSACNIEGLFQYTLFVSTQNELIKALPHEIIFESCYAHIISPGESVETEEDTPTISFTEHDGQYEVCADRSTSIPLLMTNNDSVFDNSYTLSIEHYDWLELTPVSFELETNTQGLALLTLSPTLSDLGDYTLHLASESKKGSVRVEQEINVEVQDCFELAVDIEQTQADLCGGDRHAFAVNVHNQGKFSEDVIISTDNEWTYTSDRLTLQPDQEEEITLILHPNPDHKGKDTITLTSQLASDNLITAGDSIRVKTVKREACYELDSSLRSTINVKDNTSFTSFRIENKGSKPQDITVAVNGPEWVSLEGATNISLNPGEQQHYTLRIDRDDSVELGTYEATLTFSSDQVDIEQPFSVEISEKSTIVQAVQDYFYYSRYYWYVFAVILVVALIFLKPIRAFFAKRKKEAEKEKEKRKKEDEKFEAKQQKLKEKDKKPVKKKKWSVHKKISLILIALAVLLGLAISFYPTHAKNIYDAYGQYIVVGAIALVALVVVVTIVVHVVKSIYRRVKGKE